MNPSTDGQVLPILHLNGAKISSPTVYASMPDDELRHHFYGAGWDPLMVRVHGAGAADDEKLARALDAAHRSATHHAGAARTRAGHTEQPGVPGRPATPVVFGLHGYPSAVHELLHGRPEPNRFHVHGYHEEGTTTTPYVLLASNRMTRHDLAADALRRARGPDDHRAARLLAGRDERHAGHREGRDGEQITGWRWGHDGCAS